MRGLGGPRPRRRRQQGSPRGTSVFTGQAVTAQKQKFNDQQETALHPRRGYRRQGAARFQRPDLGIQQAREDLGSYYVLGYYDNNPAADGKFRRADQFPNNTRRSSITAKGISPPKEFK
jgi:hypothetical protein